MNYALIYDKFDSRFSRFFVVFLLNIFLNFCLFLVSDIQSDSSSSNVPALLAQVTFILDFSLRKTCNEKMDTVRPRSLNPFYLSYYMSKLQEVVTHII